jgi:hypothetical protein
MTTLEELKTEVDRLRDLVRMADSDSVDTKQILRSHTQTDVADLKTDIGGLKTDVTRMDRNIGAIMRHLGVETSDES